MKILERKCETCDNSFLPFCNTSTTKFCSRKCYNEFQLSDKNPLRRRLVKDCKHCNNKFEIHAYEKTLFCSTKCAGIYRSNHPEEYPRPNSRIENDCLNCNNKFEVWPYRKDQKYCSDECAKASKRQILKCPSCLNDFESLKWENRKYCSQECFAKGSNKRQSKFSESVYEFLNLKYICEKEKYIKNNTQKLYADIFLLNYNIVIECNGDYWHCNPEIYVEDYFHKKVRKYAKEIWTFDQNKINSLNNLGYIVIVLWEYNWNNDINFFEKLKTLIEDEICKNKRNKEG